MPDPSADSRTSTDQTVRPDQYDFDGFSVHIGHRTLYRGGEPVELPSRAFDTLVFLIENRDRCVRKEEIIGAIWHDVVVTDDSLIHAISVLRRALGDERRQPRFIRTVPRRGYRFVAEVLQAPAATGTPQEQAPQTGDPAPPATAGDSGTGSVSRFTDRFPFRFRHVAAFAAAAAALLWLALPGPAPQVPGPAGIRLFQPAPPGTSIVSGGVLSPDGGYLAFIASDDETGRSALWIRALQADELRRIADSDGASKPFWSPDSRQIAYFRNGKLVATDLVDNATRTITPVFSAAGGTWSSSDTILFAEWSNGLFAVPASGDGKLSTIATLDRDAKDIAFAWPQFLPDDHRFLYQVVSLDPNRTGIYVGDLESDRHVRLVASDSHASLAPPNHLLHVRNDMLIADELDLERLELTGRAIVVARGISEPSHAAENVFSASGGLLAFRGGITRQALSWVDRNGRPLGTLALPTPLYNPRLSPDGSQLLGSGSVTSDPGLWLADLSRDQYTRLEQDAIGPIWSPDGRQLALTARGGFDLIVRSVEQPGERRLLASDGTVKILNDWSPDGKRLLYSRLDASTDLDLWLIDIASGESEPLLATPHSETQARFSPDGQWIAYVSDESGILETWVARLPGLTDRRIVSSGGGGQPQWRADQRELFYLSLERGVMSVPVAPGDRPEFGTPRELFRAGFAGEPDDARDFYAINATGTKILVDSTIREDDGQAITVMVNWSDGLSGDAARSLP